MGTTKDNLKNSDGSKSQVLEGAKKWLRSGGKSVVPSDLSLQDLSQAIDTRLGEMIIAKNQDVKNESSRHEYNQKALVHLEVARDLFQYVIEYFDLIEKTSPTEDFLKNASNVKTTGFSRLLQARNKAPAKNLVEMLTEMDGRLEKAIETRQKKTTGSGTGPTVLTYLTIVEIFFSQLKRQLAEISDLKG